jgi:hypothetical protein
MTIAVFGVVVVVVTVVFVGFGLLGCLGGSRSLGRRLPARRLVAVVVICVVIVTVFAVVVVTMRRSLAVVARATGEEGEGKRSGDENVSGHAQTLALEAMGAATATGVTPRPSWISAVRIATSACTWTRAAASVENPESPSLVSVVRTTPDRKLRESEAAGR